MSSAADQLAAAHARMTPAEIAAHALDLADELERMHQAFNAATSAHNSLVTSLANLVATQKSTVRSIHALSQAGRKREAREVLAKAVAIADLEPLTLVAGVNWSPEIFSPAAKTKEPVH
ncbi:hypothetical protein [Mesorhizobium sp. M0058]|uniref:hypothetical protein n=1 Tax=Mesorhizobium sp. M0058 TaxID=2956865 RepID=UPI00333A6AC4